MMLETVLFDAARAPASSSGFAPAFSTKKSKDAAPPQAETPRFFTSLRRWNIFEIGVFLILIMGTSGSKPSCRVKDKTVAPVNGMGFWCSLRVDNAEKGRLSGLFVSYTRIARRFIPTPKAPGRFDKRPAAPRDFLAAGIFDIGPWR